MVVHLFPVHQVQLIPIDKKLNIKKEFGTTGAPKGNLSCCGKIKECHRKTFCCCSKCPYKCSKPLTLEQAQHDADRQRNVRKQDNFLVLLYYFE